VLLIDEVIGPTTNSRRSCRRCSPTSPSRSRAGHDQGLVPPIVVVTSTGPGRCTTRQAPLPLPLVGHPAYELEVAIIRRGSGGHRRPATGWPRPVVAAVACLLQALGGGRRMRLSRVLLVGASTLVQDPRAGDRSVSVAVHDRSTHQPDPASARTRTSACAREQRSARRRCSYLRRDTQTAATGRPRHSVARRSVTSGSRRRDDRHLALVGGCRQPVVEAARAERVVHLPGPVRSDHHDRRHDGLGVQPRDREVKSRAPRQERSNSSSPDPPRRSANTEGLVSMACSSGRASRNRRS